MREFCIAGRPYACFSGEPVLPRETACFGRTSIAARATLVVAVAGFAGSVLGCSRNEAVPARSAAVSTAALNSNPQTTNFAVYAQNSATLRDRAAVSGGDVGVRVAGTGPFLVAGYELALVSDAHVDISHNVISNRLLLQTRAHVGDVQVNQLNNDGGSYSHRYPFPSAMPALPPTASVSPGSTALTVSASSTVVASPGSYAAASIGYRGVLRLRGGVYHLASLWLDNEARIEALAPVQVRVAGRFAALDRVWIGAASGVTLTAGDLRIEVSGRNGSGGSLTDSPKAAVFGNDATVHGVMLVPNGTLQPGQRATMVGAYIARDVYVDIDSTVTYQSGLGPSGCLQSCDDGNPCTIDACSVGTCVHTPSVVGSSCADSNLCNGAETCDGAGHCRAGTPVVCKALDQCHTAGVCDSATGRCSDPAQGDGTSCNDGYACTRNDVCTAGACAGTPYPCDDGLACTADTCNGDGTCTFSVTAGNCFVDGSCYADSDTNPGNQCQQCTSATSRTAWSQKAQGAPCNDQNACTANDVCDGVGHSGTPNAPSCDDSNPCTDDICDPAQGCSHPISPSQSGQVCSRNGCAANICISGSCLSDPLHTSCLTGQVPGTGFSTGSGIDRPTLPKSTAITPVGDGSYATYYSYQFGDVNRFAAKIATRRSGDHIEVHLDTLAGPLIADLETIATLPADPNDDPTIDDPTSYQRETTPLVTVPTGPHDVYFVFKNGTAGAWGGPGPWIRLAWFEFYKGRGNVDVSYVPPNSIADDPILKGTPIASQVDWAHVSAVGKNEDLPEGAHWHQYKQPAVIQPSQTASSILRLRYSMVVSVSLTWTGGPGPLEFGIYDEQDHLLVAGVPRMGRLSGTVDATTAPVSLERLVLRATNNGNTPLTVSAILGLWPNETTPGP